MLGRIHGEEAGWTQAARVQFSGNPAESEGHREMDSKSRCTLHTQRPDVGAAEKPVSGQCPVIGGQALTQG